MIYKKLFRVLTLLVSIVMMIGVCGCMNSGEKKARFSNDEILNYMKDKYGEDFDYIEPININQPTATSLSIFVRSDNFPDKKIFAKCFISNENGTKEFCDSYFTVKYEKETREKVTEISEKVYTDAKIQYVINCTAPSSFSNKILSLEEYLASTTSSISFSIFLPSSHDSGACKDEMQKLCALLKENRIACSLTIYYLEDDIQFNEINIDTPDDEHYNCKTSGHIRLDDNFDIDYEEWW